MEVILCLWLIFCLRRSNSRRKNHHHHHRRRLTLPNAFIIMRAFSFASYSLLSFCCWRLLIVSPSSVQLGDVIRTKCVTNQHNEHSTRLLTRATDQHHTNVYFYWVTLNLFEKNEFFKSFFSPLFILLFLKILSSSIQLSNEFHILCKNVLCFSLHRHSNGGYAALVWKRDNAISDMKRFLY